MDNFKGTLFIKHKNGISIVTPEIITIERKDGSTRDFPNTKAEKKNAEAFIGHRL